MKPAVHTLTQCNTTLSMQVCIYTVEKLFNCDTCGADFMHRSALKVHRSALKVHRSALKVKTHRGEPLQM